MSIPTIEFGVPGNKTRVPRIGLGTMGMSVVYGATNDAESLQALDHAAAKGCVFWDTADVYGLGHNEQLLSGALKKHYKDIFICTKFGCVFQKPATGYTGNFIDCITGVRGTRSYVHEQFQQSLDHLGVDKVDLYYQHRVDPQVPIEETVKAMAELVEQGKVRYLGLSECTADQLRRAYKVHPIAAVQIEYSPWTTVIETSGLMAACQELGVTIVAYSPLGRGFMTGQVKSIDDLASNDWRRTNPRFKPEHFENNLRLVSKFEEMARKKGCKPGQLALAWLLAQSPNLVVIPGTKRIKYLDENIAAGQIQLTKEELQQLRVLVDGANIQGDRYNAVDMMSAIK